MKYRIAICSLFVLLLFAADSMAQAEVSIKHNEIQSTLEDVESCGRISQVSRSLGQGQQWQKAYDTLRYFVEHCNQIVKTASAFNGLYTPNFLRSDDPKRFAEHLEWSKKVLYYDVVDPDYYCEDAHYMVKTFWEYKKTNEFYKEGEMAVNKYLLDSAKCDYLDPRIRTILHDDSVYLYERWRDTVTDSIKTPFKIVIPSLEELDLTILRGNPNTSIGEAAAKPTERIISFTAGRNPFGDEVSLSATLSASTMLHLAIFDELGREMYSEGLGFKQAGEYSYRIPAKGWSSGVYYARLSTSGGEVRTVKLVRE